MVHVSKLLGSAARRDLMVLAVIGALTLTFFWHYIFGSDISFPWDMMNWQFPVLYTYAKWFQRGEIMFWDPYLFGGMPDMQVIGFFYPPQLLAVMLGAIFPGGLPYRLVEYVMIGHFAVGGFAMYKYCRDENLAVLSSLTGAVIFVFGAFFPAHVENTAILYGYFWLPLLFLLAKRSLRDATVKYSLLVGLLLGVVAMTAFTRTLVYLTGAYLLYVVISELVLGWRSFRFSFLIRRIAAAALMGAGVASIELLPAFELIKEAVVTIGGPLAPISNQPFYALMGTGLYPESLITLVLPNFFGAVTGSYTGPGDITLNYLYVGVFPLILVACGFRLVRKRSEIRRLCAWTLVALVSLILGLGSLTPLPLLLYIAGASIIPGGGSYGVLVFFQFSIALASAIVIQNLGNRSSKMNARIGDVEKVLIGVLLPILALAIFLSVARYNVSQTVARSLPEFSEMVARTLSEFSMLGVSVIVSLLLIHMHRRTLFRTNLIRVFIIAFLFIDLMTFNSTTAFNSAKLNPDTFVTAVTAPNPTDTRLLTFLQQDKTIFRVSFETEGGNWGNDATGNFVQIWDLQVTRGYWAVKLKTNNEFLSLFGKESEGDIFTELNHTSPLFDLYNIKYVVTSTPLQNLDPNVDLSKFRLVYNDFYLVYLNQKAFPRAFLVPCSTVFPDDASQISAMKSPNFDPSTYVYLVEGDAHGIQNSGKNMSACSPIDETPTILQYTPTKVTILVSSPRESYLLMSDNYYPDWTALVDGQKSTLFRADLTFRAIKLSSGTHSVTLYYNPIVFEEGAALTFVSLVALVSYLVWTRAASPSKTRQPRVVRLSRSASSAIK
jgi:hypothetical protein